MLPLRALNPWYMVLAVVLTAVAFYALERRVRGVGPVSALADSLLTGSIAWLIIEYLRP